MKHVPCLSAEECAAATAALFEMREHWVQRLPDIPFFTLGAASYMDARPRPAAYLQKAERMNPILRSRFGWLYERVREALSQALGAPVVYREPGALPGFHLCLPHEAFKTPLGSIHRDIQYALLDWSAFAKPDFDGLMSFTLGVSLPSSGAGINLWLPPPGDPLPGHGVPGRPLGDLVSRYEPYTLGHAFLHSGHYVHQIAPAREIVEGEQRFTLQGHGLLCGGVWHFYW